MVKHMSHARQEYDAVYSDIRRYGGMPYEQMPFDQQDEIADCALLSYDYHDSKFDGWINRQRWQKWDVLRSGLFNRSELPF